MKKLFIQFYLLLFVCFLLMTMLVGLVYKFTAERAGRQSLDDLMKSSLYIMRSEFGDLPTREWNKTLEALDLNMSFNLHIEKLDHFKLDRLATKRLAQGDIIALDNQYTFIQRIPHTHYVLSVGPVPYLYFLHQMRLLDIGLITLISISLAIPVFIWLRPHWQDMLKIETAAQRLGEGHLDERIHFDQGSGFERLGIAFNQMADSINALINSKKQLIDGIAHELRTPLVRLRYRLEMNEEISPPQAQALNRDISQLESLIEELLTYARLDRPQTELQLRPLDLPHWLGEHISDLQAFYQHHYPQNHLQLRITQSGDYGWLDIRLLERALDNLINNAMRYSRQLVTVSLSKTDKLACLQVDDDGPGIPAAECQRIFEPFVRLDPSRDRATGGCGLGLAIVRSVAGAIGGKVSATASQQGGACFRLQWRIQQEPNADG